MTKEEAASGASAIASALFPPPIGPAIGAVGPVALVKLYDLMRQLLGGADPEALRRAELPSDAAILTDLLGDLPPDTERP